MKKIYSLLKKSELSKFILPVKINWLTFSSRGFAARFRPQPRSQGTGYVILRRPGERGETLAHADHVPLWQLKTSGRGPLQSGNWSRWALSNSKSPKYRGLTLPAMFNSTSNIIYSNVYLKVKQMSFECARPNWCKKYNSVSRKTYSFLNMTRFSYQNSIY